MKYSTIQISEQLKKELTRRKVYARETYEEIIWQIIEETEELSDSLKTAIQRGEKEIADGKIHSLEEVKNQLGI